MNTKTNIRITGDYQRKVSDFVDREILTNVNELIQALLSSEDFTNGEYSEELINVCSAQDYKEPALYAIGNASKSELKEYIEWFNDNGHEFKNKHELLNDFKKYDEISGLYDFCSEFDIEPYEHESLEFWVVSEYLGRQLINKGENVQEILGLTVWGRTCSGQSISMDNVVCDIYDLFN